MKRAYFIPLSTFILFLTTLTHGDEIAWIGHFAYSWPLTLDGDSAAWQVELPIEVYSSVTDPQLRDLVIVDGAGNAVPTAPRLAESTTTVSVRTELPAFALPAGAAPSSADGPLNLRIERDADGRVRSIGADVGAANAKTSGAPEDYLVDAGKLDAPIDNLRLDWDAAAGSVNAQYAISASDDLQSWRSIATSANVLSLARDGNRLDRHDIAITGTRAKYLRLRRVDSGAPV